MFDAYTARKAAPRIVLAVIGINLSIYLCLAAIDVTNVVGRGIGDLLTRPFVDAGAYDFGVSGVSTNLVGIVGGAGALVGAGALGILFGGIMTFAGAPLAVLGLLLILALPLMFTALAIMVTIVIRQGLLIFLTIVSPVAIACYVLPGTEKYFKQWLDLFTKTLLVYPIIAVIFAMSDVFGSIIFNSAQSAGSGLNGIVKIITGIIVIYAPLFLIPFAFRFAGGAMGKLAGVAASSAGKLSNMGPIKNRRAIAKRELGDQMTQNRATSADKFKRYASNHDNSWVGRKAARGMSRAVGGYNIEEMASAQRAQTSKVLNDQIATGRDEEIRALTVNKKRVDAMEQARVGQGEEWRYKDGVKQYKTLGGAWVSEADVDAGHARWGNNQYAQQAALSYEMKKATGDDIKRVSDNYMSVATGPGGWGMDEGEATGAFKGAGFENQNTNLAYKYTSFNPDGSAKVDHDGMVQEIYEKRASYPMSSMSHEVFEQLQQAHTQYSASGNVEKAGQVRAIAEMFVSRSYGGGGQLGEVDGQPIMAGQAAAAQTAAQAQASGAAPSDEGVIFGPTGDKLSTPQSRGEAPAPIREVNSAGSAHTNQAIYDLARSTGVLVDQPRGSYGTGDPDARQKNG